MAVCASAASARATVVVMVDSSRTQARREEGHKIWMLRQMQVMAKTSVRMPRRSPRGVHALGSSSSLPSQHASWGAVAARADSALGNSSLAGGKVRRRHVDEFAVAAAWFAGRDERPVCLWLSGADGLSGTDCWFRGVAASARRTQNLGGLIGGEGEYGEGEEEQEGDVYVQEKARKATRQSRGVAAADSDDEEDTGTAVEEEDEEEDEDEEDGEDDGFEDSNEVSESRESETAVDPIRRGLITDESRLGKARDMIRNPPTRVDQSDPSSSSGDASEEGVWDESDEEASGWERDMEAMGRTVESGKRWGMTEEEGELGGYGEEEEDEASMMFGGYDWREDELLQRQIKEAPNLNYMGQFHTYPSPFIYMKPVCSRPNEFERYPRAQNLLAGADAEEAAREARRLAVTANGGTYAEFSDVKDASDDEDEDEDTPLDKDDDDDSDDEDEDDDVDESWNAETEMLRGLSGWERMKHMWSRVGEEHKGESFMKRGSLQGSEAAGVVDAAATATTAVAALEDEELWWNWQENKGEGQIWTAWQKEAATTDAALAAAAAEVGQITLGGVKPTAVESTLARVRKKALYEERLVMEDCMREELGDMAYYSEWVSAWKEDTSKAAVKKKERETGRPMEHQILDMLSHQTMEEYHRMSGTDVRLNKDPLSMRMSEAQCKRVWGGDPVYPTVNYEQDPNHVVDFRGPTFHEPRRDPFDVVREQGRCVTKAEIEAILAREAEEEEAYMNDLDEAAFEAVDIGEDDIDDEDEEEEEEVDDVPKVTTAGLQWQAKSADEDDEDVGSKSAPTADEDDEAFNWVPVPTQLPVAALSRNGNGNGKSAAGKGAASVVDEDEEEDDGWVDEWDEAVDDDDDEDDIGEGEVRSGKGKGVQ